MGPCPPKPRSRNQWTLSFDPSGPDSTVQPTQLPRRLPMSIQMDRVHTLAATKPLPQIPPVKAQAFLQTLQNVSAARAIEKPPSPERTHSQPQAQSPSSCADDRQTQMEQSLKRSVTLIIWYRPNCDPIRLTHEISTFPLFQLSHYQSVVSDLELTPSSYIDAYNCATGHWEQHMVTTVRTIESEQRLLYKLRKSLLAGLADDECVGLADELALQVKKKQPPSVSSSPTSSSQLKRPLSDGTEAPSAKRFYFPEGYPTHVYIPPPMSYILPTQTIPYTTSVASPPVNGPTPPRSAAESTEMATPISSPFHASSLTMQSPIVPVTPLYSPNTPTTSPSTSARTSFPQQTSPPLKRWPNDYTVSDIAAGFRAMDTMVSQSSTTTQKMAFERVFGCRYVKSTVCRHRGVYRKADASLRNLFEAMGNDERAMWGEFVRRVEGRPSAGKRSGSADVEVGLQGEPPQPGGPSSQNAGEIRDDQEQTSPDQMMSPLALMTMQSDPQEILNSCASPAFDSTLVEPGADIEEA